MKIKPEDYAIMLAACKHGAAQIARSEYLARNPAIRNIAQAQDIEKRYRWDMLWASTISNHICNDVYKYANDTHIDTALKAIVKELKL